MPTRPSSGLSRAATGAAGTCVIASGRGVARGGSLARNTLGMAVMMWKCLVSGSRHRKTRIVTQCSHQPTWLTASRRGAAQPAERRGHQGGQRREVALVAVDVVGDEVGGVVQQAAQHDEEDEEEDQDGLPVGGLAIALLGAAHGEQTRGVDDQPAVEHVAHADDHGHLEQVARDEERGAQKLVRTEARDVPRRVERSAEQRDDLEHQDDEAPEDERVHDPRGLLTRQELPLAEAVDDHPPEALGDPIEAGRRPGGQQEPGPAGDDRCEHEQADRPHDRKHDVAHTLTPLDLGIARSVDQAAVEAIGRGPCPCCG